VDGVLFLSAIKVNLDGVRMLNNVLQKQRYNISAIVDGLSMVKRSMNGEARAYGSINYKLNNAYSLSVSLEDKLEALHAFINTALSKYDEAEGAILAKALILSEGNLGQINSNVGAAVGEEDYDLGDYIDKNIQDFLDWKYKDGVDVLLNILTEIDPRKYLIAGKGLRFKAIKQDGKIIMKIVGPKISSNIEYQRYLELLKEHLGGTNKWRNKTKITELVNEGLVVYDKKMTRSNKYVKKNANMFKYCEYDELSNYIDSLSKSKWANAWDVGKTTFQDSMKVFDDFRGWKGATTATKVTKAAGIVGTGLTVVSNVYDNLYVDGEWQVNAGTVKEFVVDTTVDVAAGAGAAALGAALGSFIAPPLGTAVGAGLGIGINWVINQDFNFLGGKSAVEWAKDGANALVDGIGDAGEFVKDKISEAANNISDFVDDLFW